MASYTLFRGQPVKSLSLLSFKNISGGGKPANSITHIAPSASHSTPPPLKPLPRPSVSPVIMPESVSHFILRHDSKENKTKITLFYVLNFAALLFFLMVATFAFLFLIFPVLHYAVRNFEKKLLSLLSKSPIHHPLFTV